MRDNVSCRFIYEGLKRPKDQIRLLRILPNGEGVIRLCCTTVEFRGGHYSCLSYCWGAGGSTHRVLLNGREFYIATNLHDFLLTARDQGFSDAIWIDAISINQTDGDEKSAQVEMMGDIYRYASKTFVWLGVSIEILDRLADLRHKVANSHPQKRDPESERFELCVHRINSYLKQFGQSLTKRTFEWRDEGLLDDDMIGFLTTEDLRFVAEYTDLAKNFNLCSDDLDTVFVAAYWTRAWINQEIILSQQLQVITSRGNLQITNFLDLYNTLDVAKENLWQLLRPFKASIPAIKLFFETCGNLKFTYISEGDRGRLLRHLLNLSRDNMKEGTLSLDKALPLTRNNGCKYPRDRIFSIQSLLVPEQRILPDYRSSHEDIFCKVLSIAAKSGMDIHTIHIVGRYVVEALQIEPPSHDYLSDPNDLLHESVNTENECCKIKWGRLLSRSRDLNVDDHPTGLSLCLLHPGKYWILQEYPIVLGRDGVFRWSDLHDDSGTAHVWMLEHGTWITCECKYSTPRNPRDGEYASIDRDCCFAKLSKST